MATSPPITPQGAVNDKRFDDLVKVTSDLGVEAGKGKDTAIKFYLALVEAAYQGVIDNTKNKHGNDVDDAEKLAEIYYKAQSGATVFDSKADNQRKACSLARTAIKLGGKPLGTGEPLGTVNSLMTLRLNLRKDPAKRKRLQDAVNTLMAFARQQLKRDQVLSSGELEALCYKKQAELPTAEDILSGIRNSLQKLHNGKAAGGTAVDSSAEVKAALRSLTQRLSDIAKEKALPGGVAAGKMPKPVALTPPATGAAVAKKAA